MRRVADFQINSPRLDGLVEEIIQARDGYPALNDRLKDIKLSDYEIASAELGGEVIVVTIKPGRAFIDEVPVISHSERVLTIWQPVPQADYYIYLRKDGELVCLEDASPVAVDLLLLGKVETGESIADISVTDLRPLLQKGGITGEIVEARGGHVTLGARLDSINDLIGDGLAPVYERLDAIDGLVAAELEPVRERLDSLDTAINGYAFGEKHVAEAGQRIFQLSRPYPVGHDKLRVFVNGVLVVAGAAPNGDYTETDRYTVTFNYPLTEGEKVYFLVENLVAHMGFAETYVAAAGQVEFQLTHPYPAGQGRLRVYVNGVLNWPGIDNDYVEVDFYNVSLNTPCEEGDIVRFTLESVSTDDIRAAGGYPSLAERLNSQLGDCDIDIAIEYDGHSRIVKETWSGDVSKTVEYGYDDQGRRISKIAAEGNLTITTIYTYDSAGRVSNISVRKQVV